MGLTAVVLAAGLGKRMKSELPKILHELCGRPLVDYVIEAARGAGADRIIVVVGHRSEPVRAALAGQDDLVFVTQHPQRGTGHAVQVCRDKLLEGHDPVMVLAGDAPLVRAESLRQLVQAQMAGSLACAFGTATVNHPEGLGRIIRDQNGHFRAIVEEKDATPEQRMIREVNPSYYVFDRADLLWSLDELAKRRPTNRQQEYYLTDCPGLLQDRGKGVEALNVMGAEEAYGVNSRSQLADLHVIMQQRIQAYWMEQGVTVVDPRNTYIDSRARIGMDTVIRPFSYIDGPSTIGSACSIGPFAHIVSGFELGDGQTYP